MSEGRALHLTPEFPPVLGGVADYAHGLTQELAALGWSVRILTSTRSTARKDDGYSVSPTLDAFDRRLWDAVAAEVRDFRPDVLHIHYQFQMYRGNAAVCILPWALGWRRARPAVVTTLHDMTRPQRAPALARRPAFEALLYGSDHLIVSGDAEYAGLSRRPGLRARSTMLPIGSNIELLPLAPSRRADVRAAAGCGADAFVLVYFGLVRPAKGLETLLAAVADLRQRSVPVELLVIGDVGGSQDGAPVSYRDKLVELGHSLGLQAAVRFLGNQPAAQVSELLQAGDLAVLPFAGGASTAHTTVFAALQHGLPLLTTKSPATPALLTQGAATLVPAPPTVQSLAEAIDGLMQKPERREESARKGRELADRFSRRAIATEVARIYSGLTRSTVAPESPSSQPLGATDSDLVE
jgi:glycosyltransferase involved in cell wall biosynthesis